MLRIIKIYRERSFEGNVIAFVKLIQTQHTHFSKVTCGREGRGGTKQFPLGEFLAAPGANEPNQTRSKPDRYSRKGISIPDDARPERRIKATQIHPFR